MSNPAVGSIGYNPAINNPYFMATIGSTQAGVNYNNDLMFQSLNFSQNSPTSQSQAQTSNQPSQSLTFQGNHSQQSVQNENSNEEQLTNSLTQNNPTEIKKTNLGKIIGLSVGASLPTVGKIGEIKKGLKLTDLFKNKNHIIASVVLALAGTGIGTLIDGFTNTKKTEKAEKEIIQQYQTLLQQQSTSQQTLDINS